ncbi:MAG: RNA-directed DNA polymerase, partial [Candidatus Berkelbacteria bacterium]|nr:RNA-directed DNA polymerase [Candidatus Berkelbacteria bacterium]
LARQKPLFSQAEIPIGNLTSQLFANIYLNELDKFIKRQLHLKYYVRYCDDFVILGQSYAELDNLIPLIQDFLGSKLRLRLHENKVLIRKTKQGIDFLGYVILLNCIVLRTKMKKRMIRKVNAENLASYSGILTHCKGHELEKKIAVLAEL